MFNKIILKYYYLSKMSNTVVNSHNNLHSFGLLNKHDESLNHLKL